MDKILMNNLGFYGYHGVLKEESILGQKFFFDIELYLDTKLAGITDDMNKSVSYAQVYDVVKNIDSDSKEIRLLLGVVDYDAPYLVHYDVSLHFNGYFDAKSKVYDFLIRVDMLHEISILEQKKCRLMFFIIPAFLIYLLYLLFKHKRRNRWYFYFRTCKLFDCFYTGLGFIYHYFIIPFWYSNFYCCFVGIV